MTIEMLLSSIKTIVDYDMIANGTVFALVKSDKGNYSIRQAFRNGYGEYNGFTVVRLLKNVSEEIAKIEFEDMISQIR